MQKTALMGLLLALAIALSWLEGLLPSFSSVPGVKLGLSNTVTMYCVCFAGWLPALCVALLKSCFVLLTRGAIAGLMSLAGGVVSLAVMLLANKLGASILLLSVFGAVFHNLAQLAFSALTLKSAFALYYAPVLVISGVIMGLLTASVLRLLLPALEKTGIVNYFDSEGIK